MSKSPLQTNNFFSSIQSWFSGKYDGRYLGLILVEIARQRPAVMQDLLARALNMKRRDLKHLMVLPEFAFRGSGQGMRRADLAVFTTPDDDEPMVLVEIKFRDKPLPETEVKPAQTDDYLAWQAGGEGRQVLMLTRETLRVEGLTTMTWTQAARWLRASAEESDLVAALVEHLQQEAIVMQKIEPRPLINFIKRLVCSDLGAGIGLAGNLTGPQEFGKLLLNMKLLSSRFNPDFKTAWDTAEGKHGGEVERSTRGATIDFQVEGRVKGKPEDLVDPDDSVVWDEARDGGWVTVFARHSLGSGSNWLRITYGLCIDVHGQVSEKLGAHPAVELIAWANGPALGDVEPECRVLLKSFDLITTDAEESFEMLELAVGKSLLKVLDVVDKSAKNVSPRQVEALKLLQASIGARLPAKA